MIYLNANRSAAYRWDSLQHQFQFFFFGGNGHWVRSDLLTNLYRKEAGDPPPEDWLSRYARESDWQSISDIDFVRMRNAAGTSRSGEEEPPCDPVTAPNRDTAANSSTSAAPNSCLMDAAPLTSGSSNVLTPPSGSGPDCPAACDTAAPLEPARPASAAMAAFDYSSLDQRTADTLHAAEHLIAEARRDYVVQLAQAVNIAHGALCGGGCDNLSQAHNNQHSEKTFGAWCSYVGLSRKTGERLLQVAALLNGSTPEEQAVLEAASPSLLYAAAKPSAPAELVQAVKDGDITTHKQYQELLAQLKAKEAELARVQHEAELDRKEQEDANAAAMRYKAEAERRASDQQRLEGRVQSLTEALNASRQEAQTSAARVQELEARPIEVKGADPDDIARWRAEGAKQAQAQLDKAQAEAAALRGRLEEQDRHAGAHAVALSEQVAASVETILQGHFEELDALPYDTFEKAVAPFVTLLNHLTTALNLGRWPEAD